MNVQLVGMLQLAQSLVTKSTNQTYYKTRQRGGVDRLFYWPIFSKRDCKNARVPSE